MTYKSKNWEKITNNHFVRMKKFSLLKQLNIFTYFLIGSFFLAFIAYHYGYDYDFYVMSSIFWFTIVSLFIYSMERLFYVSHLRKY